MASALHALPLPLPILLELFGHRRKQILADQSRHLDGDRRLGCVVARIGSARLLGLAPRWPQPWSPLTMMRLPIGSQALVCRVLENTPDRRAIPALFPGACRHPLLCETARRFADGQAILTDPGE